MQLFNKGFTFQEYNHVIRVIFKFTQSAQDKNSEYFWIRICEH